MTVQPPTPQVPEDEEYNPRHEEMWITLPIAREFLDLVPPEGDRPHRESRSDMWARDMARGAWRRNGQGISFRPSGERNDGQHRLNGVLKAPTIKDLDTGKVINPDFTGVWMTITWDADPRSVDSGVVRTMADRLRLEDADTKTGHYKSVAAVARWALLWDSGQRVGETGPAPSQEEILNYIQGHDGDQDDYGHPELIDSAIRGEFFARNADYPIAASVLGMGHYLINRKYGFKAAEEFLFAITSLSQAKEGTPQNAFMRTMIKNSGPKTGENWGRRNLRSYEKLAYLLIAWRAYQTGRPLSKLQFPQGGLTRESYPEP